MLIKICGITSKEEIQSINEVKPDYIGFVFAESKRKVSVDEAKELSNALNKGIKIVGVFRNNSEEEIINVLSKVPLDVIQLHGDEDNEFINRLREKSKVEIWKAIIVTSRSDMEKALKYKVNTLVLDGSIPGSGNVFNWDNLKDININKKIFLAGGINENNVLEAINKVKPDGIDTSSGVEVIDEKGRRKDKQKMKRLIRKVRENNER